MARYNELQVGRFNRALQKLFSMKGPASLVTLSDEIFPIHAFQNGIENRYLEAWDRFGVVQTVAAAAANFSMAQLRNPAGSNVIAVIEVASACGTPAGGTSAFLLSRLVQPNDLSVVLVPSQARFDPRGRNNPVMIPSSQNTTNFQIGNAVLNKTQANSMDFVLYEGMQFPLLPGDAWVMQCNVVNTPAIFSWNWRERFLEDSERA